MKRREVVSWAERGKQMKESIIVVDLKFFLIGCRFRSELFSLNKVKQELVVQLPPKNTELVLYILEYPVSVMYFSYGIWPHYVFEDSVFNNQNAWFSTASPNPYLYPPPSKKKYTCNIQTNKKLWHQYLSGYTEMCNRMSYIIFCIFWRLTTNSGSIFSVVRWPPTLCNCVEIEFPFCWDSPVNDGPAWLGTLPGICPDICACKFIFILRHFIHNLLHKKFHNSTILMAIPCRDMIHLLTLYVW